MLGAMNRQGKLRRGMAMSAARLYGSDRFIIFSHVISKLSYEQLPCARARIVHSSAREGCAHHRSPCTGKVALQGRGDCREGGAAGKVALQERRWWEGGMSCSIHFELQRGDLDSSDPPFLCGVLQQAQPMLRGVRVRSDHSD